jgi:hypothetical protein
VHHFTFPALIIYLLYYYYLFNPKAVLNADNSNLQADYDILGLSEHNKDAAEPGKCFTLL